jgi:hypothetical protein
MIPCPWRVFSAVLLGAAIAWLAPARPAAAAYFEFFTDEEALKVAFPGGEAVVEVDWSLMGKETKKDIETKVGQTLVFRRMRCFQGSKDGNVVGYACIDNVIGRSKPITFLLKINHPKGDLAHYEIMVYREEVGKETGGGPFREQFYGKTSTDPFEYGNDLRNYSGATLSANGLRDGFVKLLTVYDRFFKTLPLLAKSG